MKLLDGGRATSPRRVKIFVAEKGIEIEMEQIDLASDQHKTAEFTAINPTQRVPVLVLDDGSAICETVAICRYLEHLHPEPNLMGADPRETAHVEMWNRRMEFNLLLPISQAFRHLHPGMAALENPQIAAWGEANKPRAMAGLDLLEQALASTKYIAGDRFTIADITGKVACDLMKPARLQIPDSCPNVGRWFAEMSARPSVVAHP